MIPSESSSSPVEEGMDNERKLAVESDSKWTMDNEFQIDN